MALFTKRHYDALATHLRITVEATQPRNDEDLFDYAYGCGVQNTVVGLADILSHDNPAFDKPRFLRACGVQS